jgi:hypothetical protein
MRKHGSQRVDFCWKIQSLAVRGAVLQAAVPHPPFNPYVRFSALSTRRANFAEGLGATVDGERVKDEILALLPVLVAECAYEAGGRCRRLDDRGGFRYGRGRSRRDGIRVRACQCLSRRWCWSAWARRAASSAKRRPGTGSWQLMSRPGSPENKQTRRS